MRRTIFHRAALIVLSLTVAAGAQALTAYGDYAGDTVQYIDVTEDSATDPTPLYGTPTVSGNRLTFLPGGFRSISAGGSSDEAVGDLTLTLRSDTDLVLDTITVSYLGDYMLAGAGSPEALARMQVLVAGSDLPVPHAAFAFDSYELPASPGFGLFMRTMTIDLSGLNASEVTLNLTGVLETASGPGNTALDQFKFIELDPTTAAPVPEPGAMLLFGAGILVVGARALRRR